MIFAVNGFVLNDPSNPNAVYVNEPVTGLSLPGIRTSSADYSGRDGGYVGAQFYDSRMIAMNGVIKGMSVAAYEATRMAFIAAVATGTVLLTITTNGGALYAVNCYIDSLDIPMLQSPSQTTWTMTLLAADPTIYDNSGSGLNTVAVAPVGGGGVVWPIVWTPVIWRPGTVAQTVTNSGNVLMYPVITLTGSATNPVITNVTTGQFFAITGLATGSTDVIVIDMLNRTVLLNGSPILTFVTAPSTWWGLLPGGNAISLATSNSSDTVTGTLSWKSGYRGI